MSVATPDQLLGTQAGRYRLEKILGEGGMGCVFLGVDVDRHTRVAIKVLSKQTPENIQRFLAEARAVSLISHFNIVNLIDLSELPDGRPYMVMELVEGQSLRDAAPVATVEHITKVCCEVLAALEAAHAIGIVHRDLKPDNIMITRAGHAKVLDFGVAKLAPGVGGGNTPRTAEGLTMGTPAYMAPEQVIGGPVDARTDVYTMGVVLFEALTGQRPFTARTDVEVMRAHRDQKPPRPRALVPTIPVLVEDVILRALAKHPQQRYQSAREMAAALADAGAGRASAKKLPEETPTVHGKILRDAAPAPSRVPSMIAVAVIAIAATVVFAVARKRRNAQLPADTAVLVPVDAAAPTDAPPDAAEPPPDALPDSPAEVVDASVPTPSDAATGEARSARAEVSVPAPITRAPSFKIEAFDPIAYLPSATELARTLAPDAQLFEMQARPVTHEDVVDLSRIRGRGEYRYVSASGANARGRLCVVIVSVESTAVTARVATDKWCKMKPIAAPRCTLVRLRAKLIDAYNHEAVQGAELSFQFRGSWIVDAILSRDFPTRIDVPDC